MLILSPHVDVGVGVEHRDNSEVAGVEGLEDGEVTDAGRGSLWNTFTFRLKKRQGLTTLYNLMADKELGFS